MLFNLNETDYKRLMTDEKTRRVVDNVVKNERAFAYIRRAFGHGSYPEGSMMFVHPDVQPFVDHDSDGDTAVVMNYILDCSIHEGAIFKMPLKELTTILMETNDGVARKIISNLVENGILKYNYITSKLTLPEEYVSHLIIQEED